MNIESKINLNSIIDGGFSEIGELNGEGISKRHNELLSLLKNPNYNIFLFNENEIGDDYYDNVFEDAGLMFKKYYHELIEEFKEQVKKINSKKIKIFPYVVAAFTENREHIFIYSEKYVDILYESSIYANMYYGARPFKPVYLDEDIVWRINSLNWDKLDLRTYNLFKKVLDTYVFNNEIYGEQIDLLKDYFLDDFYKHAKNIIAYRAKQKHKLARKTLEYTDFYCEELDITLDPSRDSRNTINNLITCYNDDKISYKTADGKFIENISLEMLKKMNSVIQKHVNNIYVVENKLNNMIDEHLKTPSLDFKYVLSYLELSCPFIHEKIFEFQMKKLEKMDEEKIHRLLKKEETKCPYDITRILSNSLYENKKDTIRNSYLFEIVGKNILDFYYFYENFKNKDINKKIYLVLSFKDDFEHNEYISLGYKIDEDDISNIDLNEWLSFIYDKYLYLDDEKEKINELILVTFKDLILNNNDIREFMDTSLMPEDW